MTLSVGLFTGMRSHGQFSLEGRRLRLRGWSIHTTLAEAEAYRVGLSSLEGRVEPITSTEDTALNGFWRINSVQVDGEPGLWEGHNGFAYSIDAERVAHSTSVRHYANVWGRERSGAPAAPSEDYWHAVPSTILGYDLNGDNAVPYTRTGPGGSVIMYVDAALVGEVVSWRQTPATHYDMAPVFKVGGYPVVGDEFVQPVSGAWTLDNGLIKISGTSASTHTFEFTGLDSGTPASWSSVDYEVVAGTYLSAAEQILLPDHVRLVECNAEVCQIDLCGYVATPASTDSYEILFSIRMRRGSLYIECQARSQSNQNHLLRLVSVAMTEDSAGYTSESDADDADANRIWVASTGPWTANAGIGRYRETTASKSMDWGIGLTLAGAAAAAPNTAALQYDNYWADHQATLEVGP